MPMMQRICARPGTSALSFIRRPAGFLGVWNQTPPAFSGTAARYAGPQQGAAQVELRPPVFAAIPMGATHLCACAQLLSDPLRRQDVPAGLWDVSFAARLNNAGANFTWGGTAALHVVNGLTGQRRGTIFNTTAIGSAGRTVTTERTCLQVGIAGDAVSIFGGDYLSLELGLAVTNAAAALAPQASIFGDGTTPIGADAAATADPLAVVVAPVPLLLSLPTAGEQPRPSVTHDQCRVLIQEHFAPYSDLLYDWNTPSSTIAHVLDFLADVIKLYGYDQADRLFREVSPLTCIEMIPLWEATLGITYTSAAQLLLGVEQRRATILARLREMGPLTLFNVAAILGQLTGYAPGTAPEPIEITSADLAASAYVEQVPIGQQLVPVDSDFGPANFIRRSPVLLDGGNVRNAGVLLILDISTADTSGLHIQIEGPDFTTAVWPAAPYSLPDLSIRLVLRSPAHAGAAMHGVWTLRMWRDVAAPMVNVTQWELRVLGKGFGGRSQAKFNWSVFLDSAHQAVDERTLRGTLDRISQSYARAWYVYAKSSIPGTRLHRPGRFLPGVA